MKDENKFQIGDKVKVIATPEELDQIGLSWMEEGYTGRVTEIDWYEADTACKLDEQGYLLDGEIWVKESFIRKEE